MNRFVTFLIANMIICASCLAYHQAETHIATIVEVDRLGHLIARDDGILHEKYMLVPDKKLTGNPSVAILRMALPKGTKVGFEVDQHSKMPQGTMVGSRIVVLSPRVARDGRTVRSGGTLQTEIDLVRSRLNARHGQVRFPRTP